MTQNIIFALVIIFLMAGAFFWMWKLSRWLLIPIQIILFILLVTVVVKVFVTKDNAERLNAELEKSGIAEVESAAISGAVNALKKNTDRGTSAEAKPTETAAPAVQSVPETKKEQAPAPAAKSKEVNFINML